MNSVDEYKDKPQPGENVETEPEPEPSDTVLEPDSKKSTPLVERIPWGEYLRSQFRKIVAFLFMLLLLFFIIELSASIAPDRDLKNPDGIIDLSTTVTIYLMILSVVLFISVLFGFSKAVLIDHKEEFGILQWRSVRGIVTSLLTSSFIALVFILLDVALINIYIVIPPVYAIRGLNLALGGGMPYFDIIPSGTDRLSYSDIRSLIFSVLLLFVFLFPVVMFVTILTRYGRNVIKERREKNKEYYWKRVISLLLGIPIAELFLLFLYTSVQPSGIDILTGIITIVMVIAGLVWIGSVLFFFVNIIRILTFFTFTNILLILPFIFLFYLIPGVVWGIWDMTQIIFLDTIDNTIYQETSVFTASTDATYYLTNDLSYGEYLELFMQTVWLNLGNAVRIIELDFIIVIGLGAIVIGFAEGYSIFAIIRSISTGVSIAKSGRVASRSSPRIIVISSQIIYFGAWLSLLWDKLLIITENISVQFNLDIPLFDFPAVLTILYDINLSLLDVGGFVAVLTVLVVPFYFIITSSFKFLSVGLVLERTEEDVTTYILLISSAFILIVTNILADISALPPFLNEHRPYLPLQGITTEDFIPFVSNIFDVLESFAFYIGFGASIILAVQKFLFKRSPTE